MKAHSTVLRGNCHSGLKILWQKNGILPYLGNYKEIGTFVGKEQLAIPIFAFILKKVSTLRQR